MPENLMSEGELRTRVARYERELAWAPPDGDSDAHLVWRARTADVRATAERADAELKSRGIDRAAEPSVSATEWLEANSTKNTD